jgi:hypothetical protein
MTQALGWRLLIFDCLLQSADQLLCFQDRENRKVLLPSVQFIKSFCMEINRWRNLIGDPDIRPLQLLLAVFTFETEIGHEKVGSASFTFDGEPFGAA